MAVASGVASTTFFDGKGEKTDIEEKRSAVDPKRENMG